MGNKKYPIADNWRRQPKAETDGKLNIGKPCVLCGQNTLGEFWVRTSWMRGDDELARLCSADRKRRPEAAIAFCDNMAATKEKEE